MVSARIESYALSMASPEVIKTSSLTITTQDKSIFMSLVTHTNIRFMESK